MNPIINHTRIFVSTCLVWLASRVMPTSCQINIEAKDFSDKEHCIPQTNLDIPAEPSGTEFLPETKELIIRRCAIAALSVAKKYPEWGGDYHATTSNAAFEAFHRVMILAQDTPKDDKTMIAWLVSSITDAQEILKKMPDEPEGPRSYNEIESQVCEVSNHTSWVPIAGNKQLEKIPVAIAKRNHF